MTTQKIWHKTIPAVFSLAGAKIPKTFQKGVKTEFTNTINIHTGSNKYGLLSQKPVCEWSPHCKKSHNQWFDLNNACLEEVKEKKNLPVASHLQNLS